MNLGRALMESGRRTHQVNGGPYKGYWTCPMACITYLKEDGSRASNSLDMFFRHYVLC